MKLRFLCLAVAALAPTAHAADGLLTPGASSIWPRWQARISVQSATVSPLTLSQALYGGTPQRGVQGGALLGDYYFASPSFGSFRASGGLLLGLQGGAPVGLISSGSRLGLSVSNGGGAGGAPGTDSPGAATYLGLGFTSQTWHSGLALTADVGMVAERNAAGLGRAIFGNQGMENTLRELRLSPMLQLGLRYTF